MIYRPFTIDSQILLDAVDKLLNSPPGLVVRCRLMAPDEPAESLPRRLLQISLTGETIAFDVIDGQDLKPILDRRNPRPNNGG